jgi:hypothetical protein
MEEWAMGKHILDEKTGISYTLQGDYYLPDLTLPEDAEMRPIGLYGERHRRHLKEHQRTVYMELLYSGRLHSYLADINEQAKKRFELLVRQLAEKEGVTEKLKAENQMEWVRGMNNIRNRAEEVVLNEIIYN